MEDTRVLILRNTRRHYVHPHRLLIAHAPSAMAIPNTVKEESASFCVDWKLIPFSSPPKVQCISNPKNICLRQIQVRKVGKIKPWPTPHENVTKQHRVCSECLSGVNRIPLVVTFPKQGSEVSDEHDQPGQQIVDSCWFYLLTDLYSSHNIFQSYSIYFSASPGFTSQALLQILLHRAQSHRPAGIWHHLALSFRLFPRPFSTGFDDLLHTAET